MLRIETEKLPILVWAEPENLAGYDSAIDQAKNLANHPLARQHVALMPDFHVGYGMPIGGVFATQGGIVPNAVGVDIGCGMIACRTELDAADLDRETLGRIRQAVHRRVPVGNGPGGNQKTAQDMTWAEALATGERPVIAANLEATSRQLGTLGGGNHFIELQRDEDGRVWFMVHSGSRGLGQKVCTHYDKVARTYSREFGGTFVEKDLAFLPSGAPEYREYVDAMNWCCRFAEVNRERMLAAVAESAREVLDREVIVEQTVQTHHNYAALEQHNGEEVLVHRKGAVRAEGPVIIPGSMGTASYIGEGRALPASFRTCSHGAGRVLGRKEANRRITHEQAVEAMKHVVFGVRSGDYEEIPQAYKDIDRVIANQADLVTPTHRLVPLAVVKG